MKKKYFALLATGLFSTSLLAPISVFAADATPAPGASTTTGDVTFNKPDDSVKPVDPTDPTKPGTDNPDNPSTGQTGDLTLDAAPKLSFGTHDIASGSQTYSAEKPAAPFVQASDRRGLGTDGQAQGWDVTVSMSDFVNGSQKLPGASLAFTGATVKNTATGQGTAPVGEDIANLSSASQATSILKASKGQGAGTWASVYDPKNIKLTVPQAAAGNFTSTLNWTISAAPVQ